MYYGIVKIANRAFSYDVTAVILVFQNKEMAAILVYEATPPGTLFLCKNRLLC